MRYDPTQEPGAVAPLAGICTAVDAKLKGYAGFTNHWHPDQNVVVKNWPTWNERHKKEIEPLLGK